MEPKEVQEARGAVYRFFSGVFREPLSPGDLRSVLSEEGVSALRSLFQRCPGALELETLGHAHDGTRRDSEDLFMEYESLFRVPGGQYVHPYESAYRSSGRPGHPNEPSLMDPSITREVIGLYKAEGLEPSPGFDGQADHLATELEFMAQLCQGTSDCLGLGKLDEAEIYCGKQVAFFRDHLSRWAGTCLQRIRDRADHPFYRAVAGCLDSFIKDEKHLLADVGYETV